MKLLSIEYVPGQEIEALGGSYRLEISGQTEHISLVLPIGGEGV